MATNRRAEATEGTFSINGLQLHYLEWGDRRATPRILLLHGISGHAWQWAPFVSAFSGERSVMAPDHRGHGDSQWTEPPAYHSQDYLSDLVPLVNGLGLGRFILVGHSLGALLGTIYAASNRDRVEALVLVDIEARPPMWQVEHLHRAGIRKHPTFGSLDDMVAHETTQAGGPQYAPIEIVRSNCLHAARSLPDGRLSYKYDRATLTQFDPYDTVPLLSQIDCPALVLRGEHSMVMRREIAQEMSRILPAGAFRQIPHAGHLVFLENPSALARAVEDFLAEAGIG